MKDHYKVLNVNRNASADEIQHAYRVLALKHHPDRNAAPDAAARMAAINDAYAVLGDPTRRREYDSRPAAEEWNNGFAASVIAAAREVVLRSGWGVIQDLSRTLILERHKQRVRVVFVERLSNSMLLRLSGQYSEMVAVLAVSVENPVQVGGQLVVVDLTHGKRHGAPVLEPGLRSLLSSFL